MQSGIDEYNLMTNASKGKANFDLEGFTVHEKMLPWCGYLIDTDSLELHSDYSKYDISMIRNSIKIQNFSNPGKVLIEKRLKYFVLPKINLATLDVSISSLETVMSNLSLLFISSCLKLIVFSSGMPEFLHQKVFITCLNTIISYFFKIQSSKFRKSPSEKSSFPFSSEDIRCIAWSAFAKCILKSSQYMKELKYFPELGKGSRRTRSITELRHVYDKCMCKLKNQKSMQIKISNELSSMEDQFFETCFAQAL
jgi:hypothetical protein